jgi:energy-coupling factor transport system permease protein
MKNFVINIIPGTTFLHQLTGKTKVALFAVFVFAILMSFDLRILLPILIIVSLALISLKPNWKVVLGLFLFIFGMNFINLILYWLVDQDIGSFYTQNSPTILYQWGTRYLSLETLWYLSVRQLKLMTSFLSSLVFILSITPQELAAGLYGWGIPYKACTVVSLAFRYIPDIARDYENIQSSLQARGMEMDKRRLSLIKRLKDTLYILIPLVITSFDRIGNIANAMDLRAYGLKKTRTYYCEHDPTTWDKVFRSLAGLILVLSFAWLISGWLNGSSSSMYYPFGDIK